MTEEEIKALQDAKEAADKKAADAEAAAIAARAEADKAKTDLNGVVEEVKKLRTEKNEALAKANINNDGLDVNTLIEQALTKKEQERRKAELEDAITEFKASKPEFADAAGLVFSKFQQNLGRFNLSDVASKEQAKQRLEEIYRFVNFKAADDHQTDYDGTPSGGYPAPSNENKSTQETERLLEAAGMDKDKFTKLKGKFGDAFSNLGI